MNVSNGNAKSDGALSGTDMAMGECKRLRAVEVSFVITIGPESNLGFKLKAVVKGPMEEVNELMAKCWPRGPTG
jgi:hypothetical protein